MNHLGYDTEELLEAVRLADAATYLYECMEGCGSFDNAVFHQDDTPQCPTCGSADVATDEDLVEHVMMLLETGDDIDRMTIRESIDYRNSRWLK